MVDVFLTLGVAVPLVCCRMVYKEALSLRQLAGVLLLVFAAYIMSSYNRSIGKTRLTGRSLFILLLCGLASGTGSFCQKVFSYECVDSVYVYNFWTYHFAFTVLVMVSAGLLLKDRTSFRDNLPPKKLASLTIYLFIMALSMFLYSLFLTMAAGDLPASTLYPLMQGGILLLSMVMSALCFGEQITGQCVLGAILTFAALLLTQSSG